MIFKRLWALAVMSIGLVSCAPRASQTPPGTAPIPISPESDSTLFPVPSQTAGTRVLEPAEPEDSVITEVEITDPIEEVELTPALSPYDSTLGEVRNTIDSLLADSAFRTATWGVLIITAGGDTLYAKNARKLLVAASNIKVITAAVALQVLGPDYRFKGNALRLGLTDRMPSDYGSTYDPQWLRTRSLKDVLPTMVKNSHNRLAEQIFRSAGLEKTGRNTREGGVEIAQKTLLDLGVDPDGFIIHDGSGYDRKNYLSAETLVQVLNTLQDDSVFVNSFPIAGVDGTLARRLRGTQAMGTTLAKTGSLNGIRSLAGYMVTAAGERVMFAFLCNAYTVPGGMVTATMDSIISRVAGIEELPPIYLR